MSELYFKDIPEFLEARVNESLEARTQGIGQFKELGAPDHVHVLKVNTRSSSKEIGTYHFVSGVDASSSASLAAYLNTLSYSLEKSQQWFGKSSGWKVKQAVCCCYNAFSHMDIRVEVKIPGGVDTYALDENGQRHKVDSRIWSEAYMSEVLRSLLYSDESNSRFTGHRRFNPIPNPDAELKFYEAAEELFFLGHTLGSSPDVRVPTHVNNHLVRGIFTYVRQTCRYDGALNLFEKLRVKHPDVSVLLAELYLLMDREVNAVRILYDSIKLNPMSSTVLVIQARFLMTKGRYDLALVCAKRAVHSSPSEFASWATLAKVYMCLENFESALLALNSCPMYAYHEQDSYALPPPAKAHLPVPGNLPKSELVAEDKLGNSTASSEVTDPSLARLPSPSLRGTFAKAYDMLTQICSKVGWDELLHIRSNVFVMEEEYRTQSGQVDAGESDTSSLHPSVRTSNTEDNAATEDEAASDHGIDRPQNSLEATQLTDTIQSKRLCERWLDNLFMVLYEDLRVFTIWRAEYTHFKAQGLTYRKSPVEWEILGDVAFRLHHRVEAVEAFSACFENMFSYKAWKKLLQIYVEDGNLELVLTAIAKLTVSNYRWYQEYSPFLLEQVRNVMSQEGALKMKSVLAATNLEKEVVTLVERLYFDWANVFQIDGYDM
ncbi:ChAPs family protein [Schizosaccharomyces japonicus yFS275]|uniref:ChAPs family protein n=1 Tax=Schizosaccharomyces japonicus (strain yFS275 / FY16936) TaxID=402676 RepID=B6JWZ1_SCHJY|nr:ChAPs family protein [Schizosaccharomyces japonicus yFS275]EEB05892.1 ChAPs family protein [Schizosaccharomyces japonicus yFS275]